MPPLRLAPAAARRFARRAVLLDDGFQHRRVARDLFRFLDLALRRRGVAIDQAPREFELERDQRQRVPQQVVQVATDALAFG